MNVPVITMDRVAALAKLKAFRRRRHRDAEEVYNRAATAYEALAAGTPLISLTTAILAGGFDEKQRPRLAFARADRHEVRFHWAANNDTASFFCGASHYNKVCFTPTLYREIDMGRTSGVTRQYRDGPLPVSVEAYALVPMVPADVRPAVGQLQDWFVLWEVDQWFDRPKHMKAPRDPFLLKHLGGDLYAILAQWDLTDVERLVLEEVRRS